MTEVSKIALQCSDSETETSMSAYKLQHASMQLKLTPGRQCRAFKAWQCI